jgi:hypothetical protein
VGGVRQARDTIDYGKKLLLDFNRRDQADREGHPQLGEGCAHRSQSRQVSAGRVALPGHLQHQGLQERARTVHSHAGLQEKHHFGIEWMCARMSPA